MSPSNITLKFATMVSSMLPWFREESSVPVAGSISFFRRVVTPVVSVLLLSHYFFIAVGKFSLSRELNLYTTSHAIVVTIDASFVQVRSDLFVFPEATPRIKITLGMLPDLALRDFCYSPHSAVHRAPGNWTVRGSYMWTFPVGDAGNTSLGDAGTALGATTVVTPGSASCLLWECCILASL